MPLKLLTLNIEHDRHLERVRHTIATHLPDILCLQEVFETDAVALAGIGGYDVKYAINTYMPIGRKTGTGEGTRSWGTAVLTRVPVRSQAILYYADDPRIRVFKEPNDPRRAVIVTEIAHDGALYRIATTHFTWSAGGLPTDEQREDFARLKRVLAVYPDYVLCGDFNSPRGGEMFAKFTQDLGLVDNLPAHITTTLDAEFHYAGALELVVDNVFSTPEYQVTDVRVLEGISDHKGILATLARRG